MTQLSNRPSSRKADTCPKGVCQTPVIFYFFLYLFIRVVGSNRETAIRLAGITGIDQSLGTGLCPYLDSLSRCRWEGKDLSAIERVFPCIGGSVFWAW